MDAPSTLAGRTPRSGPRSRFLALFLGVTLGGSACLNKPTEAPDQTGSEKKSYEKETKKTPLQKENERCLINDEQEGSGIVEAQRKRMDYVKKLNFHFPIITEAPAEWGELIDKRRAFEELALYCQEYDGKKINRSSDEEINNIVYNVFGDHPYAMTIILGELTVTVPMLKINNDNCKLFLPSEGKLCENSEIGYGGMRHHTPNEIDVVLISNPSSKPHEGDHVVNEDYPSPKEHEPKKLSDLVNKDLFSLSLLPNCLQVTMLDLREARANSTKLFDEEMNEEKAKEMLKKVADDKSLNAWLNAELLSYTLLGQSVDEETLKQAIDYYWYLGVINKTFVNNFGKYAYVMWSDALQKIDSKNKKRF